MIESEIPEPLSLKLKSELVPLVLVKDAELHASSGEPEIGPLINRREMNITPSESDEPLIS